MSNIAFKLNGALVSAPAGTTILEAARLNGVEIPTLCYLKDTNKIGACRMCVVEVKGARVPQSACNTPVREGMEIETESELVVKSRRMNLELIAENHHLDCEYCPNYQGCELHTLFTRYRVDTRKYGDFAKKPEYDETAVHLGRDASRCILCRRCLSICARQGVNAIAVMGRGADSKVAAPEGLGSSICVGCGQCAAVCPTGSIFVKDDTRKVWVALNQGKKPVIAVVHPAVGTALGERFYEEPGTNVTGKLTAFLRRVGVKRVYDTNGIDAAGNKRAEIAEKMHGGKVALSGDCPAFYQYVENHYPELVDNLVKAPTAEIVVARRARAVYAAETGCDSKDIIVVSVSPCTAAKIGRLRPEHEGAIDAVLTTVEIAKMLHHACLSRYTTLDVWRKLSPEDFDTFGDSERSADLPDVLPGDTTGAIQECEIDVGGTTVRAKTVSGLGNAAALLDAVKNGTADCDYILVRACPGGCVNGGGQPKNPASVLNFDCMAAKRAAAL